MAESNEKETKNVESKKNDDDLDSLLDSALDDFTKPSQEKSTVKKEESSTSSKEDDPEVMWTEMIKQALNADPNIRDMFQQDGQAESDFFKDFTTFAEAAAKVIEGDTPPGSFAEIMTETLKNLNENSEAIQNQFNNPEELANMFQELGLSMDGPKDNSSMEDMPPFMQAIMHSFLSKEILYPSVKDYVERYPVWLEEHKATLTPEAYDNYSKQLELIKKVVGEFEAEAESDSDDVKRQRFQRIMTYMQQMQLLGQPPADLIAGDLPQDAAALPSMPTGVDPSQCSVM
uniref:Peroxin-19 n=1 Tax=Homalodisca liturata TaxID=320908 RepID=A0A1B6K2Q5_9HEMI